MDNTKNSNSKLTEFITGFMDDDSSSTKVTKKSIDFADYLQSVLDDKENNDIQISIANVLPSKYKLEMVLDNDSILDSERRRILIGNFNNVERLEQLLKCCTNIILPDYHIEITDTECGILLSYKSEIVGKNREKLAGQIFDTLVNYGERACALLDAYMLNFPNIVDAIKYIKTNKLLFISDNLEFVTVNNINVVDNVIMINDKYPLFYLKENTVLFDIVYLFDPCTTTYYYITNESIEHNNVLDLY